MNCEVRNRHNRKIELHRLPARAIVERNIETCLSSGVEQATLVRIFANHPGEGAFGNAVGDLLPRLPVIAGFIKIWLVVVVLVHRRRHISRARIERRSIQRIDLNPFRHEIFRRRHVSPVFSAVAGDIYESIIRSGPNGAGLDWGFHHGEDRVVILDAGVVFGDWPSRRVLFGLVVARQIGTDHFPTLSFVRRFEEHVSGRVERIRIVGREDQRKIPLEAIPNIACAPAHRIVRIRIHVP